MKQLALVLALVAVPLVAAAEPPSHVVNDAGATLTLDCADGGRITVNGADNTITASGGCEKVVVNGNGNKVAIASADKIVITGSKNVVTYARGWKKKLPVVSKLGTGNSLTKAP